MLLEIILGLIGFGFLNYSLPVKTIADTLHKNNLFELKNKKIYLTFDDGVNVEATPKVLDLLKKYEQKATFFLIPEFIKSYDHDIVRRIDAEGHHIALHGRDRLLSIHSGKYLQDYIDSFNYDISTILGREYVAKYFRPPSGWRSPLLYSLLKNNKMKLVMWSKFCWADSYTHNSKEIIYRFNKFSGPGKIFVFHDGNAEYSKDPRKELLLALPTILEELKRKKLKSDPLP